MRAASASACLSLSSSWRRASSASSRSESFFGGEPRGFGLSYSFLGLSPRLGLLLPLQAFALGALQLSLARRFRLRQLEPLLLEATQPAGQVFGVGVETGVGNLDGLPLRQGLQPVRQFLGTRHARAVHENRNDANVAFKRRLDLDAHEILGIVDASSLLVVADSQPLPADHRHQRIAGADALRQDTYEIEARLDIVDIEEDMIAVHPIDDAIIDETSVTRRVLTPVADEDPAVHATALGLAHVIAGSPDRPVRRASPLGDAAK